MTRHDAHHSDENCEKLNKIEQNWIKLKKKLDKIEIENCIKLTQILLNVNIIGITALNSDSITLPTSIALT